MIRGYVIEYVLVQFMIILLYHSIKCVNTKKLGWNLKVAIEG